MNDSPRVLGNRYEVGELLGRGGMAEVHLGHDARLGRTVAIKLLRTDLARDPTFQARFRREAQSSAALNHPAIVGVYDTGEESVVESGGAVVNLPYIVMERIEGRTLRDVLAEGHHLDVDAALDITTGVLTALEYSHRIGIVHRDIKPANVMLTPVGDVKVMDFGIARAMADASSTMTQTQAVIGTAQYLSPEQARGEQVDTRSDLYSAGCLLYELLTGRPPFIADSPVAVAYQHVQKAPTPPSQIVDGIPESVDRIVLHSLAKGREERYQTASDFRADVEAARGGRQVYATVPAMNNSQYATTQYVPTVDATGTRLAPAAAGGMLGADTTGAGTGAPNDPYDPYGQEDEYGGRRQQRDEEKSNAGMIMAIIAVIIVIALVGFFVAHALGGKKDVGSTNGGTGSSTSLQMPNEVGQDPDTAIAALVKAGFSKSNITQKTKASDDVDKGLVSDQDPKADASVAPTDPIVLTVSSGPASLSIPDETGKSLATAKTDLLGAEFTLGSTKYESSTSQPAGHVIRTSPKAGSSAAPGDQVTIYVAESTVTVPTNIIGKSPAFAQNALANLGLVGVIKLVTAEPEDAGKVVRAVPGVGTSVAPGSKVTLDVARAQVQDSPSPTPTLSTTPTPTPTPTITNSDGDGKKGR